MSYLFSFAPAVKDSKWLLVLFPAVASYVIVNMMKKRYNFTAVENKDAQRVRKSPVTSFLLCAALGALS